MLRRDVEMIAYAALQSVDPYRAVQEYVRYDDQSGCLYIGDEKIMMPNNSCVVQRIQIGAFGKAAAAMTAALVDVLRDTAIEISGICICKDGHVTKEQAALLRANGVDVYEASHPIPDARGVAASRKLLEMINMDHNNDNNNFDHDSSSSSTASTTLKICCISGGGSALFCTPICSLDDLRTTNERLLASGLDIIQINKVRKRLEHGKGGGLHADVALILSDVNGDPLDSIASGPTTVVASRSNDEDLSFVQELDLPEKVLEIIMSSSPAAAKAETDRSCRNILVGNNQKAVRAASDQARQLGYTVIPLGTEIQGEASQIGRELITTASNYQAMSNYKAITSSLAEKVAWIGGGETTVTLPQEHGLGGRNQELALSAAIAMQEEKCNSRDGGSTLLMVASIGTDGTDGPTDAAGAIVDQYTVGNYSDDDMKEAKQALVSHDAYPYLKKQKALYTVRDKIMGQCVSCCTSGFFFFFGTL
jgi:glycerate 2-kinase